MVAQDTRHAGLTGAPPMFHHTRSRYVVSLFVYLLTVTACSPDELTSGEVPDPDDPCTTCVKLVALKISPDTASLAPEQSLTFAANGIRKDGSVSSIKVIWRVNGGTIDGAGNYTAGTTPGTYQLIASSPSGALVDTADVFVTTSAPTLTGIVVTPSSASLASGTTQKFTASGTMSDGTTRSVPVTWTATGGTVDGTGLYQAGSTSGSYHIIAQQLNGMLADTSAISVTSGTPGGPAEHEGWHVSSTGSSSGNGSATAPWSLAYALGGAGGKIQPGDTVWLRGGTYRGAYRSTLTGTSSAPIVVRQYPGERAVIDGNGTANNTSTFAVAGPWVVFWGFEVTNSDPNRVTSSTSSFERPNTVVSYASHTKYVNLVVHDGGVGFYTDPSVQDVEIYGCIIYNNGWQGPDRGHGHALYLKSYTGPVVARDNILFTQYGYGIHGYTNAGSGGLNNIRLEGNIAFNNGTVSSNSTSANILMGGYEPVQGARIIDNMTYFSSGAGGTNVRLGYSSIESVDALAENNYFAGGSRVLDVLSWQSLIVRGNHLFGTSHLVGLSDPTLSGYNWTGNTYYRDANAAAWFNGGSGYTFSGWRAATGLGASDQTAATPTQPKVFVRPNDYEKGRATVVVFNWSGQGAVLADISGVLQIGDRYEVRNVQDLFSSPILSQSYGGGAISLPMGGVTPPKPIGGSVTPPKTGPYFDVFVVSKVES